ncbi:transcriptional activator domain-containing protein [Oscillochloris trichoides DG-6]|uniref:Transcriptional activator domain-containing protein n=1 Tax=Oscillochloris trichoides DG-6 TaxID=765420 RepID=E1ICK4_9CHLR|nr:AAA family ATPase [Oscillochloris trichoides]EFO81091.1 transcriptional activator domain-containing protein [Oscillochloris trichoides DG-6]
MLSILLLGSPRILRDGVPVEIARRRPRYLIYYLAAQPGPVGREQILAIFWPDHERGAAQQLLRTSLHAARKALGDTLITTDDQLSLRADVHVDLRLLATAVQGDAVAALAAALAAYQGDLLAGVQVEDSPAFEEWLLAERERVRLLVLRGLGRLARLYEARGEYAAALAALLQALDLDPLQEDLQRAAMRLHYVLGDRVAAIRRYEELRDLLDAEMGVPPMAETRALYDAVITDSLQIDPPPLPSRPLLATPPPPATLPFAGRGTELALLETALAAGHLALIEGEPGIGKTRLAHECAQRRGGLVLLAEAHELEQSLPYHPLATALRTLLAHPDWPVLHARINLDPLWWHEVARLLPELHPQTAPLAPPDEARLWEALARFLGALAQIQPFALVFDDIQWADSSTLGLIGYLLRRSPGPHLALLATSRPAAPRSGVAILAATLLREGRLTRVALSRLTPADTLSIARNLSPVYANLLADWLQRHAEGNPYITNELVDHARHTGLLLANGTLNLTMLAQGVVVPQTVYSLIQNRLLRLSDEARRVLDAAAAVGREFEFEVAARASALSEAAALDALDELCATRLVLPLEDGRFTFDHSLTLEVAEREVAAPRQRLLHRRVGEALEALHRNRLDGVAGLIASHYTRGGAIERAATYALRAGQQAARVAAWAEAAAFYTQALAGTPDAERHPLLLALGEALHNAGEIAAAVEHLRSALATAVSPAEERAARLALARTILAQGRYAEMIELVRPLHDCPLANDAISAEFLWGTALSLEGADLSAAAAHLRRAEAQIGEQVRADPVALAQVRFELGSVLAQQGDLPQAIALYREALAVAEQAGQGAEQWRILAHNNLAYHLHLLGNVEEAEAQIRAGLALAEARGALTLLPYLRSTAGEVALARGHLDMAEEQFRLGLDLAERLDIPERIAGLRANQGLLAIRRAQPQQASVHLRAALSRADDLGIHHLAAQIRVWLAPLTAPDERRTLLAEARASAERAGRSRILAQIEALEERM